MPTIKRTKEGVIYAHPIGKHKGKKIYEITAVPKDGFNKYGRKR